MQSLHLFPCRSRSTTPRAAASWLSVALLVALALAAGATPAAAEERVFEMRTYYAADGKLDALNARFRDHTVKLFEKHGMDVIGFWEPLKEEQGKGTQLIYILAFPSEDARAEAWKAFGTDPEWKKVAEESQKDGRLITKIDSVMMSPSDYSAIK